MSVNILQPATHRSIANAPRLSLSGPPLSIDMPDISWLGRAPSGEDQRFSGPCGIFATASVIEAALRTVITFKQRMAAYEWAIKRAGRKLGDGLYITECVEAAVHFGWIKSNCRAVWAKLADLVRAPLIGAYKVNECLDQANARGVLDHSQAARRSKERGRHAMACLAYGFVRNERKPRVAGENSWVPFGERGLWTCTNDLHSELCTELWLIEGLEPVP